ncbi:hypothetical protein FM104_00040 [Microbacterium esteraromaticum]|uniref:Uncharacterized protein n=1 Tax=Microbacterium esteraromaticum TaxID=57043 RepID=A0A1R4I7I8_9MICO|nr:hypothetical protein [Microbacterium esteraromaticum]SJN15263.1 hypothetical protein FM104_00040 [Microbacterium esteraromaticum]
MTDERQHVVRVAGARRAQLTPMPGTTPVPDRRADEPPNAPSSESGPNDDRMLREVPPHY